jgi:hypothetical protein
MIMIGWEVNVGGKFECWRVVIGWEENIGVKIVKF